MKIYSASELQEITERVRESEQEGLIVGFAACAFSGFVVGVLVGYWMWY